MSRRRALWTTLLLLGCGAILSAQDKPVIAGTDQDRTQVLVETLTKENQTLKSDTERLNKRASELQARVTQAYKTVDDLIALLAEAKVRFAELASLNPQLVDRALVVKAKEASDQYRDLIKAISSRIDALHVQAAADAQLVRECLAGVSVNEARWARNTEDLLLLNSMLSKTKLQETQMAEVVGRLEELAKRAGSLLSQDPVARP